MRINIRLFKYTFTYLTLKCESQQTSCLVFFFISCSCLNEKQAALGAAVYISCHLQLLTAYYSSSQCGFQNTE